MIEHKARKRFGQNFLHDPAVIHRILRAVQPQAGQTLIEIGPGQGAITEGLVESGADVTAIEIDKDLIRYLTVAFINKTNFQLIDSDALKIDFSTLVRAEQPLRVVGNLPYNISTPLLFHLLAYKMHIKDMYFMLQKEVVDRMAAGPNCKAYGKLSIMCQYHCDVQKVIDVPPGCFNPPPKVQSAVVKLSVRDYPGMALNSLESLSKVVSTAFQQRRKTISNALKSLLSATELESCQINTSLRPDNLSIDDYITIANYLNAQTATR